MAFIFILLSVFLIQLFRTLNFISDVCDVSAIYSALNHPLLSSSRDFANKKLLLFQFEVQGS